MSHPVVAIVGAGSMGTNHARVIASSSSATLGLVIDRDLEVAERLAELHSARASSDLEAAFSADAVIIAASTAAHVDCAIPLIQRGIPVLIEKPVATRIADVDLLLQAARDHDVPIMCGFVERFNAAFQTALLQLDGPPQHVIALRHSPPAPRIASSVVGDVLLHDLDLVLQLFDYADPRIVGAVRYRPDGAEFDEIVDCQLAFPTGLATLSADRTTQLKVRAMTIHTPTLSIDVDLLRQDVTVYENIGHEMIQRDERSGYRSSSVIDIPFVRHAGEPLALQFEHFILLVKGSVDQNIERERIRPAHALMEEVAHRD